MEMENIGYNQFFDTSFKKLNLDSFLVARVIAENRGLYKIKNVNGEYFARITGKNRFNTSSKEDFPVVGDWVVIDLVDKESATIHTILPRKTVLKRKRSGKNEAQIIAANINVALIVESVDQDYNLNRFERYISIAKDRGIKPVIMLNKIDLISKDELDSKISQIKDRFNDIDFISTSVVTDKGINELKSYMDRGKTYCFLGSSGVGKSSLINKLLGQETIKISDIDIRTGRGKHTTTKREIYFLNNGSIVIDNPGMREVGMADAKIGIEKTFKEISLLGEKCKYPDCAHTHEPGCNVLSALKEDKLDRDKYLNYINLKKEAEYYEMTSIEKREKDRKFGKFIKTAKKQLRGYKY